MTYKALLPALALLITFAQVAQSQTQPATLVLTATIRDMDVDYEDFEGPVATDPGIVKKELGTDGKPQYAHGEGKTATTHGETKFKRWYNAIDYVTEISIPLTEKDDDSGVYTYKSDKFFPIDKVGDDANWGYGHSGNDAAGESHNFHFTMELHTRFTYQNAKNLKFTFSGDDDVWVFINGKLVIDLGGVHTTMTDTVILNDNIEYLDLEEGATCTLDFFFAERHTVESNFMIETSIELVTVPTCDPKCTKQPRFCERTDVRRPAVVRKNGLTNGSVAATLSAA